MADETLLQRITMDPAVMGGKPCIRNMRFSVTQMLELLAAGMSEADILEDYPYLQADDIRACLAYAARLADAKTIRRLRA
jgi:uncharacterized protein (DUF433 family)